MTLEKFLKLIVRPKHWKAFVTNATLAGVEHESIVSFVRPQAIIDVGANKGQFSLAARAASPGARIIAFEALGEAADIYRRNFRQDKLVHLHQCALSNVSGDVIFHVADRRDSSSLLKPGSLQKNIFGVHEEGTISVPARRLDDIVLPDQLGERTLLKIDVQGAELLVLEGALELLSRIDYIYAEVSFTSLYDNQALFDDVRAFLQLHSFKLVGFANAQFDAQFGPIQADALFARIGID